MTTEALSAESASTGAPPALNLRIPELSQLRQRLSHPSQLGQRLTELSQRGQRLPRLAWLVLRISELSQLGQRIPELSKLSKGTTGALPARSAISGALLAPQGDYRSPPSSVSD